MKKLVAINSVVDIATRVFRDRMDMAAWCSVAKSNISDWIRADKVPDRWKYKMDREARRRGYLINPKLFGDKPTPEEKTILDRKSAAA